MVTTAVRRTAILTTSAALVLSGISLAFGPAGVAAGHPAAPAKTKYLSSSLQGIAVAPHSKVGFAFGSHNTAAGSSIYALRGAGSHWKSVSFKQSTGAVFTGIAAGAPNSAWVAGYRYTGTTYVPVIEHSTGGGFKPMKTSLGSVTVTGVSASSKSNAWIVGTTSTSTAFAAKWNGHKWAKVKTPSTTGLSLSEVSASSPKNVWVLANSVGGPAVGHWNGHKFKFKGVPVPSGGNVTGIATGGAKNTWVTGAKGVGTKGKVVPFTTHWNGHSWKMASTPTPGFRTQPTGVSMAGSKVFLVGQVGSKLGTTFAPFALRFKGGHWRTAKTAKRGKQSDFRAVGVSSKAVVAVGDWSLRGQCVSNPSPVNPLLEVLHGNSFGTSSTPRVRRASASTRTYAPATPSC